MSVYLSACFNSGTAGRNLTLFSMDVVPLNATADASLLLPTVVSTNKVDARTSEVRATDSGVIYGDKSLKSIRLSM